MSLPSLLKAYNKTSWYIHFCNSETSKRIVLTPPLHIKDHKTNSLIISRTRSRAILTKHCHGGHIVTEYMSICYTSFTDKGQSRSQTLIIEKFDLYFRILLQQIGENPDRKEQIRHLTFYLARRSFRQELNEMSRLDYFVLSWNSR